MTELFDVQTPAEAWRIFSERFRSSVKTERLSVLLSLDRILAEDIFSPHDLPAFPRSTVDGFAVAAIDTYGATASLPAYLEVVGEVSMGQPPQISLDEGQAVLVHTGGMIASDSDAVVMVEDTQRIRQEDTSAGSQSERVDPESEFHPHSIEVLKPVAVGQNVIQIGEDVRQGQPVLVKGHQIRPQDIGGLLALGITEITVAVRPTVAILSQGDEVVSPDQEPGPGQVRDINSYTLAALAHRAGGIPITYSIIPDDFQALQSAAARALADADILVMSAGSSVSFRDMTAQVIEGLGSPGILIHGVSVRPGKPTILALAAGKPVFGLPGNPVSAMVIFDLFVNPAIRSLLGADAVVKTRVTARLSRNIASVSGREDYVQVRLESRAGELWAIPVFGKSNLIYTLIRSDGAVKVPLDSNGIADGQLVTVELH
ncbi:MAG: gephyrin-like molybdotransferase Glp [Chloroflexota bacterium]|nr:gephyrin-like molybdotransferase Glp [Chloroflexota bacterium]